MKSIMRVNNENVSIQSEVETKRPDGSQKTQTEIAAEHFHQVVKFAFNLEEVPAEG